MVVKKLALLTIPLLAAMTFGSITAYAADGGTIYPEDEDFVKTLTFTSLTDYAVEDGLYAFADGRLVKVYNEGNYTEYAFTDNVTAVDIEDGIIYCGSDGKSYTVDDQLECDYKFEEPLKSITLDNYYYYFKNGDLKVFDEVEETVETYTGYSNLKLCDGKVYAMAENKLYEFAGSKSSGVELEYSVDKSDLKITIGQAASNLKEYAPVQFVEIEAGTFMTEIDLEKLDSEYFTNVSVKKTDKSITALLLCYSGNAAIVSIQGSAYVLLKSKVSKVEIDYSAEIPFANAQMIGGNIYASPFVVSGTVSNSNATGITVTVTGKIEHDILECAFYEVEYTSNGKTVKGYVAEGFLSKVIIEDNKQPENVTDPAYSDKSDTKTILIIFAVVVLVIAAAAYIAHVSAKGKNKKKKTEEPKEQK